MAVSFSLSLLLVALLTTTGLRLISVAEILPSTLPSSPPPPPPTDPTTYTPPPRHQLNNIVDALNSTGDFAGWAGLLSFTDPSVVPLNATFFIPSNDAISHFPARSAAGINFDPFLIPYHIVPQRLTFSDLQQFTIHTRLPTLLPYKSIVITNNTPSNFTIDDSQIAQPDVVVNAAISVHGVKKVLEYSVYGGEDCPSPPHRNSKSPRPRPRRVPAKKRKPVSPREITVGLNSGAPSSWCDILMIFSTSCVASVLNIL